MKKSFESLTKKTNKKKSEGIERGIGEKDKGIVLKITDLIPISLKNTKSVWSRGIGEGIEIHLKTGSTD